jgi:hypothetical protein
LSQQALTCFALFPRPPRTVSSCLLPPFPPLIPSPPSAGQVFSPPHPSARFSPRLPYPYSSHSPFRLPHITTPPTLSPRGVEPERHRCRC